MPDAGCVNSASADRQMAGSDRRALRIRRAWHRVRLPADDLTTEVLVRLLRKEGIDARHFSPADIDTGLPPGADPDGVAMIYVVSAFPSAERTRADSISRQLQELFPGATLIRVFCPGVAARSEPAEGGSAPAAVGCLEEAVQISQSWQKARSKPKSKGVDRRQTVALGSTH